MMLPSWVSKPRKCKQTLVTAGSTAMEVVATLPAAVAEEEEGGQFQPEELTKHTVAPEIGSDDHGEDTEEEAEPASLVGGHSKEVIIATFLFITLFTTNPH